MILLLVLSNTSFSNNLTISNVSATNTGVTFNIAWDNSWNVSTAPANYDAVWIFIKSQDCSGAKTWDHVNIAASGHTIGGSVLQIVPSADRTGAFIQRISTGSGNISATQVTLNFQTAFSSVSSVNFDVNGIEMVYVPQGSFSVGDNNTSNYSFGSNNTTAAASISSEAAISAGGLRNSASNWTSWSATSQSVGTNHGAIPAAFPKGFAGFYCMKYEITQGQYAHFLNLLTFTQQTNRVTNPSGVLGAGALIATSGTARNSIEISSPAAGNPIAPAVFGNDLSGNNVFNENADGASIACNYLSWDDLRAYLDWAALRPMTELEFEKACRGPETPVNSGYPWGTNVQNAALGTITTGTGGTPAESTSQVGAVLGICNWNGGTGPLRVGYAATSASGRTQSGASYYGIMELAGNVWEQTLTVGGAYGAAFQISGPTFAGSHGNGTINTNGFADVSDWGSPADATNSILRGGAYDQSYSSNSAFNYILSSISDRYQLEKSPKFNVIRNISVGGRGVRTN